MKIFSVRFINLIITFVALMLLAISYCLQYGIGLQPCPLCLIQRYALLLIGVVFLLATWQKPKRIGQQIYAAMGSLFAILGAAAAGRQIWLQQQPLGAIDSCIPNFKYLLKFMPIHKALKLLIDSPANCAQINWQFLGISMAGWSLGFFCTLLIAALYQISILRSTAEIMLD